MSSPSRSSSARRMRAWRIAATVTSRPWGVSKGQQPRLRHVLDAPAQPFPTKARVLHPAVGHRIGAPGRDVVDDDPAHLELVMGKERVIERAGEDPALESEAAVVDGPQRIL